MSKPLEDDIFYARFFFNSIFSHIQILEKNFLQIYYQGGMPIWFGLAYFIAFPIVAFVLLPVLYDLKFTSIYEVIQFSNHSRKITNSPLYPTVRWFSGRVIIIEHRKRHGLESGRRTISPNGENKWKRNGSKNFFEFLLLRSRCCDSVSDRSKPIVQKSG